MTATKPPCQLDPEAWDLDGKRVHAERVAFMIDQCTRSCPMLAECVKLDDGSLFGVVAGRYRPWPGTSAITGLSNAQNKCARIMAGITITASRMRPGQELPKMDVICAEYNASRTTVGAALRHLADVDRILDRPVTKRRGYRVAQRTENAA